MRWAYGVTTVPGRKDNLLPRTLASLKNGGFDEPRLFVDGTKDSKWYEDKFGLEVTVRYPTIRTAGNWTLALAELYFRNVEAERFAIFQDDFVTYKNLRRYLDRCDYPETGYWNLYTFKSNEPAILRKEGLPAPPTDNHVGFYESNQHGRGAVALVFSRQAVMTLLTHPHMVERPSDPLRGWKAIDGGIVESFKKAKWKEYVHSPTLVQHTGFESSMGNKPHKQSRLWMGEDYDALEMLGKSSSVVTSRQLIPKCSS